jgi:RimJ/RimL family protein N-acetyltransferase
MPPSSPGRESSSADLPFAAGRVVLRRLATSDLERFQAYRADRETGRYQGWQPMTEAAAVQFLDGMRTAPFPVAGEWFQLGIADSDTGALIGDIGVCVRTDPELHAEIGFTLAAAAQGNGLATEAVRALTQWLFASTTVNRVTAITDARNLPSIRLLERIGMRLEATEPAIFRDEPCHEHHYVLDRPGGPAL